MNYYYLKCFELDCIIHNVVIENLTPFCFFIIFLFVGDAGCEL
jgi:hypothetical protein